MLKNNPSVPLLPSRTGICIEICRLHVGVVAVRVGHVTCTYLKIILTTANKNIFHFNSLGLIPVVLIAAVLAGSGCFVIKKDHAENFANIQTLTDQLRADNVNTIKTVAAMKKSIDQKDSIIKELQQKVTAGNEKNRLVSLAFRYDTVSASL